MRPFWWKTVLTAIAFSLLGGIILAMNSIPEYGADIRQGTQFALDTVETVKLVDGRFVWPSKYDQALPATANLPHLRMDIVNNWAEFAPPVSSTRRQGVVLCQEGIGFWLKNENGETMVKELVMPVAKFKSLPEDALVLSQERHSEFCRLSFWTLMMSLVFAQTVSMMKTFFPTGLVLAFAWLIIGRIRPLKAFWRFLAIAFNLCLPPFLVSLLWVFFGVGADFDSIFTLLFFVYLIYAIIEGRRGQLLPAP